MAGESVRLGTGRCPVCASSKARYTLSAKGLSVITCNACNFQGFARSERSDELLRANITPEPAAAPAAPEPVAAVVATKPPAAPPAPAAAPKPAERRSLMSW